MTWVLRSLMVPAGVGQSEQVVVVAQRQQIGVEQGNFVVAVA
jgi:hypothetical protein